MITENHFIVTIAVGELEVDNYLRTTYLQREEQSAGPPRLSDAATDEFAPAESLTTQVSTGLRATLTSEAS